MKTIDAFPGIDFVRLGPGFDDATATSLAWDVSNFMHDEIHEPVYKALEREDGKGGFGLRFIDTDPPSGTPGDIPWRVEAMRTNNAVQPDGAYREYLVAIERTNDGTILEGRSAIAGLLVATKRQGICAGQTHRPTRIAEIDVARRMYGTRLSLHLLSMLHETHAEDPYVDLWAYEHNTRAQRFYGKLGFVIDYETPPRDGEVFAGKWIRMLTTGRTFSERLHALL